MTSGIGFIETFPDSIEDYRVKHEISSNYRLNAVILICPRLKNAAMIADNSKAEKLMNSKRNLE